MADFLHLGLDFLIIQMVSSWLLPYSHQTNCHLLWKVFSSIIFYSSSSSIFLIITRQNYLICLCAAFTHFSTFSFFFLEERLKTIALFVLKSVFIRVVIVKIQWTMSWVDWWMHAHMDTWMMGGCMHTWACRWWGDACTSMWRNGWIYKFMDG